GFDGVAAFEDGERGGVHARGDAVEVGGCDQFGGFFEGFAALDGGADEGHFGGEDAGAGRPAVEGEFGVCVHVVTVLRRSGPVIWRRAAWSGRRVAARSPMRSRRSRWLLVRTVGRWCSHRVSMTADRWSESQSETRTEPT